MLLINLVIPDVHCAKRCHEIDKPGGYAFPFIAGPVWAKASWKRLQMASCEEVWAEFTLSSLEMPDPSRLVAALCCCMAWPSLLVGPQLPWWLAILAMAGGCRRRLHRTRVTAHSRSSWLEMVVGRLLKKQDLRSLKQEPALGAYAPALAWPWQMDESS